MAITGGLTASRSHTSCGTSWKPHLNLPVVASIAAIDSVQRLSPGRIEPSRSGDGLPIATNSVLLASSYAGVIHIEPPPCCQASAYLAESAFSWARSRFRSSPSGVVLEKGPHQRAARRIERLHVAADAVFGARGADDDIVTDYERGHRLGVAGLRPVAH